MGAVESKVPDEFGSLPAKQQKSYRSMFKRLVAAGTSEDVALLELCAIYCAVEDPEAFIDGADFDGDGRVSAKEVEKLMLMAGASTPDARKASRAMIHAADVDHNGKADSDELGVFAHPAQIRHAIDAGGVVFDVRLDADGAAPPSGPSVPGAIHLPCLHDDEGLSFAAALKALPIVVHAEKGRLAADAVARLKEFGFTHVVHALDAASINKALKDGPSPTELADLADAEQDEVAERDKFERAGRLAAKAAVVQAGNKRNAKVVAGQAASAAATTIKAKAATKEAAKEAAKAAATTIKAKEVSKEAAKEAAKAAATTIKAKEVSKEAGKEAAKAAATTIKAKEAHDEAAVMAAATAALTLESGKTK